MAKMLLLLMFLSCFRQPIAKKYGLDEYLNVREIEDINKTSNKNNKYYSKLPFSLRCEGYENNGTHCLSRTSSDCGKLNEVNYKVETFGEQKVDDDFPTNCSYSFKDILKKDPENPIRLELFSVDSKLYLDVFTKLEVPSLDEKIACYAFKTSAKKIPKRKLYRKVENDVRRFVLSISDILKSYFCNFVYPPKYKPAVSNIVYASKNAISSFTIYFNDTINNSVVTKNPNYLIINRYFGNATNAYNTIIYGSNKTSLNEVREEITKVHGAPINVFRNEYCLEINEENIIWPETRVYKTAIPYNVCVNSDYKILTRKCENSVFGPKWADLNENCTNFNLSEITKFLIDIDKKNVSEDRLNNISKFLEEYEKLTNFDIYLVITYLFKIDNYYEQFFDLIAKVIDQISVVNPKLLNEDLVVKFINLKHSFYNYLLETNRIIFKNNSDKLQLYIINSTANSSLQLITKNIDVSLPKSLSENSKFAAIVYNEPEIFSKLKLKSWVIDLNIIESEQNYVTFTEPAILTFKYRHSNNSKCVYWDTKTNSWLSIGIQTLYVNQDEIECRSYHLTRFALLVISEDIVRELSGEYFHDYELCSIIECFVSILGILLLLILALVFPRWRKKRQNIVHLSFVILFELTILLTVYYNRFKDDHSFAIGVCLQLFTLVKFGIMFLIAKSKLANFIGILRRINNKTNTTCWCLQHSLVWIISGIIVTISFVFFNEYYEEKYGVYYPQKELFMIAVLLPVGMISVINTSVFVYLMVRISSLQSKTTKKKILKFKLAALLWFILGGSWIFSTVVQLVPNDIIKQMFYYSFCFVTPLQGFVIFLFYVVLDKNTSFPWFNSFRSTS